MGDGPAAESRLDHSGEEGMDDTNMKMWKKVVGAILVPRLAPVLLAGVTAIALSAAAWESWARGTGKDAGAGPEVVLWLNAEWRAQVKVQQGKTTVEDRISIIYKAEARYKLIPSARDPNILHPPRNIPWQGSCSVEGGGHSDNGISWTYFPGPQKPSVPGVGMNLRQGTFGFPVGGPIDFNPGGGCDVAVKGKALNVPWDAPGPAYTFLTLLATDAQKKVGAAQEEVGAEIRGTFEPYSQSFERNGGFFGEGSRPEGKGTWRISYGVSFGAEHVTVRIVSPGPDSNHVFGSKVPAVLEIKAEAKVDPAKYEKEVTWEVQDIQGSRKTIKPEKGNKVTITFNKLPEKNDQFGLKKITAKVRGKQDQVTVKVFFAKDGRDNPEGKYPNWFYYWRQGVVTGLERFQYERGGGSYDPKTGKLVIGDEAASSLPGGTVPLKNEVMKPDGKKCKVQGMIKIVQTEGADSVARVVTHELEHERLFKLTGGKRTGDQDQDGVPDAVELGELGSLFCLDPRNDNTHELKKPKDGASGDDELLAMFAEAKESESKSRVKRDKDWASPGSQSKTGN